MKRALCLGLALVCAAAVADEMPASSLHRNPFERPSLQAEAPVPAVGSGVPRSVPKPESWNPRLLGTVVAGKDSVADIDGKVVLVGQQVHGLRLVEVRERAVVLKGEGVEHVIRMDPEASPAPRP